MGDFWTETQRGETRHCISRRRAGDASAAGWAIGGLVQIGDLAAHGLEAALIRLALVGLLHFLRAGLQHQPIKS